MHVSLTVQNALKSINISRIRCC